MKLIAYEKSADIIGMFALKSSILMLHQKGLVQPGRDAMATSQSYQLFGIQDQAGVIVGALDICLSIKHGTARCGLFLESGELKLKNVIAGLKQLCEAASLAKVDVSILCGEEGIADTMRDVGFLPEVRHRSHMFIGGSLYPVTEYGCVL